MYQLPLQLHQPPLTVINETAAPEVLRFKQDRWQAGNMRQFALLSAERNNFVTDCPSFAQHSTVDQIHQQIRRTVPLQTAAWFGARSSTSMNTANWAVQIFELLTLHNVKLSVQSYSDTDAVFIVLLNSPVSVHIARSARSHTAECQCSVYVLCRAAACLGR